MREYIRDLFISVMSEHAAIVFAVIAIIWTFDLFMDLKEYLDSRDAMRERFERCEERLATVLDPALARDIPVSELLKSAAELTGAVTGIPLNFSPKENTVHTLVEYTYEFKTYRSVLVRKLSLGNKFFYKPGDEITVYIDPKYPGIPQPDTFQDELLKKPLRSCIIDSAVAAVFWMLVICC